MSNMSDDEYYDTTYQLKFLIRYSNVPRINHESVAEHSFFVATILLNLHEKYEFDLGEALKMAICHDLPEAYTNDISHRTKVMFPEINEILKKAEIKMSENFPSSIAEAIKEGLGDSIEAEFVRFADAIQCYQYSKTEVSMGNKGYMSEVLTSSTHRMDKFTKELIQYERS